MLIQVQRIFTCPEYTIGHLYVDGSYVCDTLEDADRGLDDAMTEDEIVKKKIKGITAIPTGKYKILMNVLSPKYSSSSYYKKICNGRVPRLEYVKGFAGILIHTGNYASNTEGCLLVGYNKQKGMVLNSKMAFERLYAMMRSANSIGQQIYIEITRKYKI